MKKLDKLIFGLFLGGTLPLLFGLLSLLIWFYLDTNENRAPYYVLTGLLFGLVIDIRFLKGWMDKRYELPEWIAAAIYIFYNILVYGMFMGFPVFNILPGLPAGYYWGKRMQFNHLSIEESRLQIKRISLFTGLVIFVLCISSGFIALNGKGVGMDIRMMFGLGFEVTKPMLLGITVIGGIFLIWLQVVVIRITMKYTLRHRV